jgi:hypothetical protein
MSYARHNSPKENLDVLSEVSYPGRLLVVGKSAGGLAMQVYVVGGRSEGSRNRVLID